VVFTNHRLDFSRRRSNKRGLFKETKAIDSNSDDHKPVIKQDPDGGFFYIVDSTDGEVGNRNDDNSKSDEPKYRRFVAVF
jgi:hypothetical protein